MTATEASRGFSELLDTVASGETITVTRGGEVVAEIRPATRRTGRDLDAALGSSRLSDDDARELTAAIEEARALPPYDGDPWRDA